MELKLFTFLFAFFAQILGLSTVFAGCYYDYLTSVYKCYSYSYNLFSYTLGTGTIIGIIIGALAGLATLIGFIVFLYYILCRKPTQNQGVVIYNPNTTTGTIIQNQSVIQPTNQQGLYPANFGLMQPTGQSVAVSLASPNEYSPPQQSTQNQDPPPK